MSSRGTRGFLIHGENINMETNIKDIKEELKIVVLDKNYKDKYNFYKIKGNIKQLEQDIIYIEKNEKTIIKIVLKEVYKIVPKEVKVKSNIYLYGGGIDGGFTINRNNIFINYGEYIGNRGEFIKILCHEIYHSRKIEMLNRFCFSLNIILSENTITNEIMAKIMEEGIGLLVQHGSVLKKDDPTGTLTKRKLIFIKDDFDLLNHILLDAKNGISNYKKARKLDIYVLGYYIVSTIYNKKGVVILDNWTVKLQYKTIIKEYIDICNENNMSSGFTDEVENWIIN